MAQAIAILLAVLVLPVIVQAERHDFAGQYGGEDVKAGLQAAAHGHISRPEIELASFVKSPLAPLSQKGVIPPFGKGRSGGIFRECLDNYETLDEGMLHAGMDSPPINGQVNGGRPSGTWSRDGEPPASQAAFLAAAPARTATPQTPAAPPGQGVTRFRRISIEDRQVIGGEAVSFLVPKDWTVEGGIAWRQHPALPAGARIRVFDPHSLQQVEAFPSFPYTWGDNCGPGKLMPIGASWFGNEVHPPFRSAREVLETGIIPRIRSTVRWNVVGREDLPRLAEAHRRNTPAEPGAQIAYDAARVRIGYVLNGVPVEEDVFTVMQVTRVPAGNIVIQVADRVVAMRAERGRLDAARPVHVSIVNSAKINVQWFNRYAQLVEYFIRAKMQEIRAIGEFSRALSRTSAQISEQRMQQWQDTNRRQDRLNREWSEYIRGTETYSDPVRGEPVELPSTHRHAWVSRSGEYILTDNPNYNPNVEQRGDWVEMQPTP